MQRENRYELRIASDTQPEVPTYWRTYDQRAAMALDFLASGYTVEYGNHPEPAHMGDSQADSLRTRTDRAIKEAAAGL